MCVTKTSTQTIRTTDFFCRDEPRPATGLNVEPELHHVSSEVIVDPSVDRSSPHAKRGASGRERIRLSFLAP